MQAPDQYESHIHIPGRVNDEYLPKLIKLMTWSPSHGQNVLDYGCGPGSTGYKHILPLVLDPEFPESRMYSVDVSPKMVDFASKNYAHNKITYNAGDISGDFPFRDIKFSRIFAINVFHFIRDIKKALAGFQDILEPGGQLGFTSNTMQSWVCQSWRILGESKSWKEYMHGYQRFMPEWAAYEGDGETYFRKLLEGAGFHVKFLELVTREYVFENMNDCLDIFVSTNPCLDAIPEELHPCLKTDIRKIVTEFAGIPFDSPGFNLPYEYLSAVVERK